MPRLSVIIPTLNEEAYLVPALRSVRFADEIVVVDSFSTDATHKMAAKEGAKVVTRAFDNFSAQKNFGLEQIRGDWVLFLDADERITYALQQEIMAAIQSNTHGGYKLSFPHFFMNRFLYSQKSSVLRLVKREGAQFTGLVHEKLHCNGSISTLESPVLHYTYKGLMHYIHKKESYAWFQAEQLHKKGKRTHVFQMFSRPFFRFLKAYVLKGGFREGIPGLAIAGLNAYGVFSRYAKLILLQRGMR